MVIGVDRLDYTKGLEERFEAFERLLEIAPELRGRVSLMQIAAPTREGIAEYQAMQEALERLSGHVNGRFGRLDWTPISYINRAYGHEQVAALHRVARIGLVTPLRDGMNLVAKEYVAAQDPDDPGVLVLSRFAGAAEALTDALLVNPHDRDETAEAIRTALAMPKDERQARWARMMDGLRAHDVHRWRQNFLDALDGAVQTAGGGTGGAGRLTRTGRPLKAVASGGAETWAGR
jgi:trehalose 6-phosphate synthase